MADLLHHVATGDARDHALLLVHPLGADLTFWDDFIAAVGEACSTVACDLRGAGRSPRTDRPVSLEEHVVDLEALRAALGIDTVTVIGCAIGAMAAASYAAAFPERVQALVLANPTPRTLSGAKVMLSERADLVRREGMQAILPGAVERAFLNLPQDTRYTRYMNRFSQQDAGQYALALLAAAEADAEDALRGLRCPTLLVPGRHDVLLPMANAEAVVALLPSAHMSVVEDAAHFVPFQQPQRFAELVLDFVGRRSAVASHLSEPRT